MKQVRAKAAGFDGKLYREKGEEFQVEAIPPHLACWVEEVGSDESAGKQKPKVEASKSQPKKTGDVDVI